MEKPGCRQEQPGLQAVHGHPQRGAEGVSPDSPKPRGKTKASGRKAPVLPESGDVWETY